MAEIDGGAVHAVREEEVKELVVVEFGRELSDGALDGGCDNDALSKRLSCAQCEGGGGSALGYG